MGEIIKKQTCKRFRARKERDVMPVCNGNENTSKGKENENVVWVVRVLLKKIEKRTTTGSGQENKNEKTATTTTRGENKNS